MDRRFLVKEVKNADWQKELELIGFDKSYRHKASDKFMFKDLKIYSLTPAQANILKQTALSVGADCATNREVITGKAETSDAILSGSFSQLDKISKKLEHQPFGLSELAKVIEEQLVEKQVKTKIVGILNITPNSFSDGGKYNTTEAACEHFRQLVSDGADMIDIGAESTKPGAPAISAEVQLEKILPVLNFAKENKYNIPISIDTRSAEVAEECLKNGVAVINDVSGLKYDDKMAEVVAKYQAKVIIQHSLGLEKNMVQDVNYTSVVDDVYKDLYKQIEYAKSVGVTDIITDIGFGFDKDLEDNFRLFNRIDEFSSLGYPIMAGISRKSMLNMKDAPNEEKDIFTLALDAIMVEHSVDYLRVHNVKLHRKLIDIYRKDLR